MRFVQNQGEHWMFCMKGGSVQTCLKMFDLEDHPRSKQTQLVGFLTKGMGKLLYLVIKFLLHSL